ncbi:AMP-binding protein [Shewanella aestuarii]|uniref:AMP-binding protein n=1 Tax=Shewanella aestuarii TaxID=1028752 RepID=A0A6G9QJ95_9GAMM|nr:AMP-binding protein [Shewanella aestuarii]QIR13951.1 AMP-binding protein [Shewanella aestuarii]
MNNTSSHFYQIIEQHAQGTPEAMALIDNHQSLNYQQLLEQIDDRVAWLKQLINNKGVIGLQFSATIWHVVTYLACLKAKIPLLLIDPQLDEQIAQQQSINLGANWLITGEANYIKLTDRPIDTRSDLAILLSTSGSTGAAKSIMLSENNLFSNAQSICQYLPMTNTDTGIASLPLSYSYGLSLLNTHLVIGACFVLTTESLISKTFWQLMSQHKVTSLAGVPFSYQMLKRLRIDTMDLPALKYLTQAGGKLSADLVMHFHHITQSSGRAFYVMYGQTEASARIAYLPPQYLPEHSDCIGIAIPNGKLILRDINTDEAITAPDVEGQLCYQGPNVMLGYASSPSDLSSQQVITELKTGDIAEITSKGLIKITGRLNRILKIQGKRFSLDHLEQVLLQYTGQHCYCFGEDDQLMVAIPHHLAIETIKQFFSQQYKLHPSLFSIIQLDTIPRLSNGKPDYRKLKLIKEQNNAV